MWSTVDYRSLKESVYLNLVVIVVSAVSHVLSTTTTPSPEAQAPASQFEAYLMSIGKNESVPDTAANVNNSQSLPLSSGDGEYSVHSPDDNTSRPVDSPGGAAANNSQQEDADDPLNGQKSDELLAYFRDVPRGHWSCCMLGLLAGNKGFQCHAEFYSQGQQLRFSNRPHPGRAADRTKTYEITRTFRRCVTHKAKEFHKCCHVAVTEKKELREARNYRKNGRSNNRGRRRRRRRRRRR